MDITIIGTGNMGRGIATRALAGDHSVTLLGTETAKAEALAGELSGDVRAGQVGDPLAGDVVVLASGTVLSMTSLANGDPMSLPGVCCIE
jgi:hypothetical protein